VELSLGSQSKSTFLRISRKQKNSPLTRAPLRSVKGKREKVKGKKNSINRADSPKAEGVVKPVAGIEPVTKSRTAKPRIGNPRTTA